jgi:hypothetical protein
MIEKSVPPPVLPGNIKLWSEVSGCDSYNILLHNLLQ